MLVGLDRCFDWAIDSRGRLHLSPNDLTQNTDIQKRLRTKTRSFFRLANSNTDWFVADFVFVLDAPLDKRRFANENHISQG